jgi:hypothetical protein
MISDERDAVNCDQAEKVGQAIQDKLDGISILASKIKRKDQVRSMMTLQNNTKKWSLITPLCCSRDW